TGSVERVRSPWGRPHGPRRLKEPDMRRLHIGFAVLMVAAMAMARSPAAAAPRARRTVIEVFPGPSAIRNAVASANPGDTLNIHAGTYTERVSVNVQDLTLRSAGDGDVTVDQGCQS